MKKLTVIALILLGLGLLLCIAGTLLHSGVPASITTPWGYVLVDADARDGSFGIRFKGEAEHEYGVNSLDYTTEEVRRISLQETAANIEVSPSDDGDIHITRTGEPLRSYTVSCRDGVLTLNGETLPLWRPGSGNDPTLVVKIPQGLVLDVESDAGNITLENVSFASGELSCDMGNIVLAGVTVTGALELQCDAGNVELESLRAQRLSGEVDLGQLKLTQVELSGPLELENDCGNIELWGVSAEDYRLSCSLGNISGRLPGSLSDYAVRAQVSLGECSLPAATRGRIPLSVEADCGNVDLHFADER